MVAFVKSCEQSAGCYGLTGPCDSGERGPGVVILNFEFEHCCNLADYETSYVTASGIAGSLGSVALSGCGLVTASLGVPSFGYDGDNMTITFTRTGPFDHAGGEFQGLNANGDVVVVGAVGNGASTTFPI